MGVVRFVHPRVYFLERSDSNDSMNAGSNPIQCSFFLRRELACLGQGPQAVDWGSVSRKLS